MKRKMGMLIILLLCAVMLTAAANAENAPGMEEMVSNETAAMIRIDLDADWDNEARLDDYVQKLLDAGRNTKRGMPRSTAYGNSRLTASEQALYNLLKPEIESIASGARAGAKITLTNEALRSAGIPVGPWTAEELGVENLSSAQSNVAILEKAGLSSENLTNATNALLSDCPSEMYWFSGIYGSSFGIRSTSSNGVTISKGLGQYNVYFTVAEPYRQDGDEYTVNSSQVQTAQAAIARAQQLANSTTGTDLEKMLAFKEWICDAVSYDEDARDNPDQPDCGPWQLIYVFDDNENTNVVCEGYSKAFKYLCDLSGIPCILATGDMTGGTGAGLHMWNIVTMDDNRHYLVDVTNCDTDSAGYPDKLFMAYGPAGDWDSYTFSKIGITYTYDANAKATFSEGTLTLSPYRYGRDDVDPNDSKFEITIPLPQHGFVTADKQYADEGETVTLTVTPDSGYTLDVCSYQVASGSNPPSLSMSNGQIIIVMGNSDITVTVTFAEEIVASGDCGANGDNLTWTLASDGTLTISGTGAMYNYGSNYVNGKWITTAPWGIAPTSAVIENGVTRIGEHSFSGCTSLTSVTIPDSVTSIDYGAFDGCSGLTNVTIPDSVTSINHYAFHDCTGLTSVTIPDSVTSIGSQAFSKCFSLTSVTIPDGVTSIGDDAFYFCSGLTSVTISDSVTSIGSGTFSDCYRLTSVTIPDGVTSIGHGAFNRCFSLTSVTIPDGVTSIGEWAFSDCSALTSVTIPDSVTNIGDYAFIRCFSLTSVTIPDGVTNIGICPFSDCEKMTIINVDAGNRSYCSVNGVLMDKEKTRIIQCPAGMSGVYVIPDSVTSIDYGAFDGCSGLTNVTIPDSVTSINHYAFHDCTCLTSITIPASVTSIGDRTFSNCSDLANVTIPDIVTSIGDYAFYGCTGLNNLMIGNSVTDIGMAAFCDCTSLTSVTVPDSVTSIGEDAFAGCRNLTIRGIAGSYAETYANDNGIPFEAIPGDKITDSGTCGDNLTWTLTDEGLLTISGTGAMDNYDRNWSSHAAPWGTLITEAVIEDGVTSIGSMAFDNCVLTSVTIPDSVTVICDQAFMNCYNLTSIALPERLASLGEMVFWGCESLTAIEVPENNNAYCDVDGVVYTKDKTQIIAYPGGKMDASYTILDGTTVIKNGAFGGECLYFTSITIPDSVKSIGMRAFAGCQYLTSVEIPDGVTSIGDYTFYQCTDLTSVTIPNSVTSIGIYAFGNCTSLTSVTLPVSVSIFDQSAFDGCDSLSIYSWAADNRTVTAYRPNGQPAETETVNATAAVTASPGMDTEGRAIWTSNAFANPAFSVQTKETVLPALGGLRLLLLPAGLESIEEEAFAGDTFEAVILPEGCESIGKLAFANCESLVYVRVPASVTSIAMDAFIGCGTVIIDRVE